MHFGCLDMLPEGQSRKFEIKRMRAIDNKNVSSFKTCGKTQEAIELESRQFIDNRKLIRKASCNTDIYTTNV